MEPILYTIILVVLVVLLCASIGFLCFGIFTDYCAKSDNSLNKYAFHRTDVEDLTTIQGDFKKISSRISYRNEVSSDKANKLLKRHNRSLSDIVEDSHSEAYSTVYSIEEVILANKLKQTMHNKDTENAGLSTTNSSVDGDASSIVAQKHVQIADDSQENLTTAAVQTNGGDPYAKFKFKPEISSSVDNLEFCDPHAIDVLKSIHNIEDVAKNVEREIDCFIGGVKNLKYFELNEKLIRCMIALSDTLCFNEELRKKKSETLAYIGACQTKLKNKVA